MKVIALLHAAAAAALCAAAFRAGTLAAFAAAVPCWLLVAQAIAVARGPRAEASWRSVGLGAATLLIGTGMLLFGHGGPAVLALGGGLAVVLCGTTLALRNDPPVSGQELPGWRLALHAGVAVDEAVRLSLEVRRLVKSRADYEGFAAEARIAADRNQAEGWLARPERAHPIPPPVEKLEIAPFGLAGFGAAERLCFASEFEPQDPEIRGEYLAAQRNRTAEALLFRRRGGPRPTLVFVHGYGGGRSFLEARATGLAALRQELGLDLALFVLPLHGRRKLAWRSGAGFFGGSPLWTNAAMGQAVWDLRRLVGFLRADGAGAVGVFGVGLGGYVAATLASVDERLACAVTMCAPASLETLLWRQLPSAQRAAARAAGLSHHVLEHAWARHAPLRMRPRLPHQARLVIGGLADRIVVPEQAAALWEHWGQPASHWFPGTHFVWLGREGLRARLATHLRETLRDAV